MKLSTIVENPLMHYYNPRALDRHRRRLADVMPPFKVKHSLQVAKQLAKAGAPKHVVDAGLFHDYPERSGTPAPQDIGLDQGAHPLIQHMTNPDKTNQDDPLPHLQEIMPTLDPETRNNLVLVKIADRVNNLKRRVREERLSPQYLQASKRLLSWLISQYTGQRGQLQFLLLKLNSLGIQL